mmetsp:Transcript_8320/g.10828  ORF Transcript_8320/g.10828 Transcript_8320/m.10828 type:complete len:271 (+) Transcript_8320:943-1755(+)
MSELSKEADVRVKFLNVELLLKQPDSLLDPEADESDEKEGITTVSGTTGWTVWNANFVALRYLESKGQAWFKNKEILDLSAGLGMVGIACAKAGANVTISEVGSRQLECIQNNVEMNDVAHRTKVVELPWGDKTAFQRLMQSRDNLGFDIVVASDLVYIAVRDSIHNLLVNTLSELMQSGSENILLVYEERVRPEEEKLLDLLKEKNQNLNLFHHSQSDICCKDIMQSNNTPGSDSDDSCNSTDENFGLENLMEEELTFHMYTIKIDSKK